jgi:hypothetical protein
MAMSAILRQRITSTLAFVGLGALTGCLIGVSATAFDDTAILWNAVRGASIGILIGFVFGVGEEFTVPSLSRRLSFGLLNFSRVMAYAVVILIALVVVNAVRFALVLDVDLAGAAWVHVTDGNSTRELLFGTLSSSST